MIVIILAPSSTEASHLADTLGSRLDTLPKATALLGVPVAVAPLIHTTSVLRPAPEASDESAPQPLASFSDDGLLLIMLGGAVAAFAFLCIGIRFCRRQKHPVKLTASRCRVSNDQSSERRSQHESAGVAVGEDSVRLSAGSLGSDQGPSPPTSMCSTLPRVLSRKLSSRILGGLGRSKTDVMSYALNVTEDLDDDDETFGSEPPVLSHLKQPSCQVGLGSAFDSLRMATEPESFHESSLPAFEANAIQVDASRTSSLPRRLANFPTRMACLSRARATNAARLQPAPQLSAQPSPTPPVAQPFGTLPTQRLDDDLDVSVCSACAPRRGSLGTCGRDRRASSGPPVDANASEARRGSLATRGRDRRSTGAQPRTSLSPVRLEPGEEQIISLEI